MIKNNELRIGNYVTWQDDDEVFPLKVIGFIGGDLWIEDTEEDTTDIDFGSVRPIPLTPEILEKCGFEKDYDGFYCIDIGRKWFSISVDEWASICFKSDIGLSAINLNSDIEYLHQLQNLIYALTCTELEIKF